jgi:predicted dehydrogenase
VYRYYPTVREARERIRTGAAGAVRLIHGNYLQDWLLKPEDENWRVDEQLGGASRAFADIGSHWCDLAEFVTGHRIARVCARMVTATPRRGTEDAAVVQFETDGGAIGTTVISQISAGRKNQLLLEVSAADESLAFNQEEPETLWRGRREAAIVVKRDPEALSPSAARYAWLPPGHPQGYGDCFDALVAEVYAAVAAGEAPEGLPQFADGLRAARITAAVLTSSQTDSWVEVPT